MSPADLVNRLECAVAALADLECRQDQIYVEWTLLQADAAVLARKFEAFAQCVPGCLGTPQKERVK